ncbi:MAG TPA: hypothetical protein VGF19_14310 [Candidatus Acidoferrum sp.]|jgi:hypothetical protein
MKTVQVESYAGYKADERPLRLKLPSETLEIAEVEDRWYAPGETVFRVRVANGDRYLLRHVEAQDVWALEGYRAGASHRTTD